jgi:hypothetical protein
MHRLLTVAAFALALSQTACMSLSTMQTARTLAPGQSQWTSGTGSYTYEQPDANPEYGTERVTGHYYEMSFRNGLTDRMDWGGRMMFFGSGVLDLKYQFFNGYRFDAAVGAGLGFWGASDEDDAGDDDSTTIVDVILPAYLSYEVSPFITPYLAPRMVWRKQSPEGEGSQALLGITAGVKVGTHQGVYIEYGYQNDLKSGFSARQFNLAWFWRH